VVFGIKLQVCWFRNSSNAFCRRRRRRPAPKA